MGVCLTHERSADKSDVKRGVSFLAEAFDPGQLGKGGYAREDRVSGDWRREVSYILGKLSISPVPSLSPG